MSEGTTDWVFVIGCPAYVYLTFNKRKGTGCVWCSFPLCNVHMCLKTFLTWVQFPFLSFDNFIAT